MANPTWYDILGVGRDATAAEIKAAWRDATDKFEPGSGQTQFRLFNEAADVLLDPEKRAAYDAELGGAAEVAAEPVVEEQVAAEPVVEEPVVEEPVVEEAPATAPPPPPPAPELSVEESAGGPAGGLLARVSWFVVSILAVLTVAAVVLVAVLANHIQGKVDVAEAAAAASAAAERAMVPTLSYDYRHMEDDRDRATSYMAPKFKKEFVKNFGLLTQAADGEIGPAVKLKVVVSADVLATGVVEASADKVKVLVFVNQSSVKAGGQPTIFQNRVVATMVHQGDAWLIEDIETY